MRREVTAELTVTERGRASVVSAAGALDADNVGDLEQALARAVDSSEERVRTILDLSGLEFADSSVLHALLASQRRHRAVGKRLVVCGPYRHVVHRLFEVTGTSAYFELTADLDTALSPAR
ncbi:MULTISPECIES: STAS domain-containing protein [Streptomyces]|uniref:STAS domain-containing protein n=1 Tax=Streptomyces sp. SYP-A7185 TaxID=3040076 RepID=UPI0038F6E394